MNAIDFIAFMLCVLAFWFKRGEEDKVFYYSFNPNLCYLVRFW